MRILSCGAGMQSTALALMSCENKLSGYQVHPEVPIYDAIIFCDLGHEPPWVHKQVEFIQKQCNCFGIPFYILDTHLYRDYKENFGRRRVISVPFWTVREDGKKGKMPRHCTVTYKIYKIQDFVRHEILGYKKYQRIRPEDRKAHEMHIGFSNEEKQRIFDNTHPLFVNKFPLVEMGLERPDNYRYCFEKWGLDTKASACTFCPFHRNYFFRYMKEQFPEVYSELVEFDEMLEREQSNTKITSQLFISRIRKRLRDLTCEDCQDGETFEYNGNRIWNGF